MRLHFRESSVDYRHYTFPYRVLAEKESSDTLASIYEQGFLPASNDYAEERELFYLARSLRLDLRELGFDKKRRYLQHRGTETGLHSNRLSIKELMASHPRWKESVIEWVEGRFQPPYMTSERLEYILKRNFLTQCIATYCDTELVGITLLPHDAAIAHYWFVFYDPEWNPARSLGKWILGDCGRLHQEQGFEYLYLGTCYTKTAAYKFQGIASGVEFYEGSTWSDSIEELQKRLTSDGLSSD